MCAGSRGAGYAYIHATPPPLPTLRRKLHVHENNKIKKEMTSSLVKNPVN